MVDNVAPSARAWRLLGLLTSLNILNFVDRQLIASLTVPIERELGLSDQQIALLVGYAFATLYCVAGVYLGSVADRRNRPRLIACGLLVWSAATAASGLATNFPQLAAARIAVGVGEAVLTPSALAMLGDVFPTNRRALASGVYYLGLPLGAGLSLIVAGLAGQYFGWRHCFFGLGWVGVAAALVVWFVKDPVRGAMDGPLVQRSASRPVGSSLGSIREMYHVIRSTPSLALTMVASFISVFANGGTLLDPKWLHYDRGFDFWNGLVFLGVLFAIGGSVGNVLGGWLGDWCSQHWHGGRLLAIVGVVAVLTPFSILYRLLPPSSPLFPISCCLGSILVTLGYGPVLGTVQDLTPANVRATTVALTVLGQNLLGASLGVLVAAMLREPLGGLTWSLLVTGQAGLLALPLYLLAVRYYPKDPARRTLLAEVAA